MAQSAVQLNADKMSKMVNQVAHGFEVGEIVIYNAGGNNYIRALADNEVDCGGSMMVSYVYSADLFALTQSGFVYGLTLQDPYTAGARYFLSPTQPGKLTTTKPTGVGEVELECFYPVSTTSGFFWGGAGELIASGALFQWNTVSANTVMASNNGYITDGAANFNLQLPSAPIDGDVIKIATLGTGIITITQTVFTEVQMVDLTTTNGVGGTITLQQTGGLYKGTIELVCIVPLLKWMVTSGTGIWTPA